MKLATVYDNYEQVYSLIMNTMMHSLKLTFIFQSQSSSRPLQMWKEDDERMIEVVGYKQEGEK